MNTLTYTALNTVTNSPVKTITNTTVDIIMKSIKTVVHTVISNDSRGRLRVLIIEAVFRQRGL